MDEDVRTLRPAAPASVPRSGWWRGENLLGRFSRYTAGSVLAAAISEAVLLSCYGLGAPAAVSSVAAFVGGAVPNYLLNRRWAWGRRSGRQNPRQAGGYLAVILGTAGLAVVLTSLTDLWCRHAVSSHTAQVLLVGAAYLLTYAVMFLVKFALFDRLVFADRSRR